MAQIIVKTPVTSNGSNPVLDSHGHIIYKETILNDAPGYNGARATIERQNKKRTNHLKWIVSDYSEKPTATKEVASPTEQPTSELSNESKPKTTRRAKDSSK